MLGKFGLEELVFRAGEEIGRGAGDGGDKVVDGDGLAVEGALLVGVGGELDRLDGAGLLGNDGPEVAVVAGDGEGQQGFKAPGSKSGRKTAAGCGARRVVELRPLAEMLSEKLGGVGRGGDVDGRAVDDGAQLHVAQAGWPAERRSVLERE